MSLLRRILDVLRPRQTTFVYCDCGNELVSDDGAMEDTDGVVTYRCSRCRAESRWLFDAPVPIRLREVGGG